MDGILNILKPTGMSSFSVIARLRKILNMKKIGHTGTLDPMAEGVLPVCIGKATKVIEFMVLDDKEYICAMRLGKSTDTQDAEGRTLEEGSVTAVSPIDICNEIEKNVGDIMQVPPMYSAIKINGERLYKLAREGVTVEREARKITIYGIEVLSIAQDEKMYNFNDNNCFMCDNEVEVKFVVKCSKGTYIRTLCNDIGERLGCYGYMYHLFRSEVGGKFKSEDAVTLEQVEKFVAEGTIDKFLKDCTYVLDYMERIDVSEEMAKCLLFGQRKRIDSKYVDNKYTIFSEKDEFLGIGEVNSGILKMYKSFGCII